MWESAFLQVSLAINIWTVYATSLSPNNWDYSTNINNNSNNNIRHIFIHQLRSSHEFNLKTFPVDVSFFCDIQKDERQRLSISHSIICFQSNNSYHMFCWRVQFYATCMYKWIYDSSYQQPAAAIIIFMISMMWDWTMRIKNKYKSRASHLFIMMGGYFFLLYLLEGTFC